MHKHTGTVSELHDAITLYSHRSHFHICDTITHYIQHALKARVHIQNAEYQFSGNYSFILREILANFNTVRPSNCSLRSWTQNRRSLQSGGFTPDKVWTSNFNNYVFSLDKSPSRRIAHLHYVTGRTLRCCTCNAPQISAFFFLSAPPPPPLQKKL